MCKILVCWSYLCQRLCANLHLAYVNLAMFCAALRQANNYSPEAVFMSHTYAMSVRSPMSDIAVINHSDCKEVHKLQ